MDKKLNICQISLKGNISILKENLLNFNKFYQNNFHYIICPKKEKIFFLDKINDLNCNIIDEDSILSFDTFKATANKYLINKSYFKLIQPRLNWYYQQVLKLIFAMKYSINNKKNIVIWDADTVILKKILFFKDKKAINYGTTNEFHKAYYETNKNLLKKLPKYYISSLTQFISLTPSDAKYLLKNLCLKMNKDFGNNLTKVIFKSITKTHNIYNGSMFSEYELIGQSNLLKQYSKQKLISGLRENLNGRLTEFQKKIIFILGFYHITYEHTHKNINSHKMLNRNQKWLSFLKLLAKKLSNNIFRGIKHHINFFLK